MADDTKRSKRLLPGATGARKKRTTQVRVSNTPNTDDEKTEMMPTPRAGTRAVTRVGARDETVVRTIADVEATQIMTPKSAVADEATVVMKTPAHDSPKKGSARFSLGGKKSLRSFAVALAIFVIVWDTLFPEEDEEKKSGLLKIRIEMPTAANVEEDPAKSQRFYEEGLRSYLQDTVEGYARAARAFHQSFQFQNANTRALAFLASSYLNVLDNADRDETSVLAIGKILDQIRARKVDLAETLIAQVEYALLTRAYRTAEQLIADYTRTRKYELEMFYYFALTKYYQRALLMEDIPGRVDGAVEEVLRWASPLMHMRRTATEDVTIGDADIKAGDKVVLWYCSGNRDEDVYEDPFTFDILREPNRHQAFGGGGPHYCLGSALARTMLKTLLTEVYTRIPDIDAPEADVLVANFINGIKRLPATWTPPAG